MLGYTPANAVNFAALRIGVENNVSALRADQIKRCLVAFEDIGFSLDVVPGYHSAVSIKTLIASEAISRRPGFRGFQADTYGIQPAHVAIVHEIGHLRQSASADTQARSH